MFRRSLAIAVLLSLAMPALAADGTPDNVTAVMNHTIVDVVRPGYAAFDTQTQALDGTIDRLCAAPTPDALEAARIAFRHTALAWAGVENIRFGPVMDENRLERVLFWPDRKGIGLRQVQAALASQDLTAADPATLKAKSVAMQGLTALEFVLFGTGADDLAASAGYRCAYAGAIAANLASISGRLTTLWADPDGAVSFWTAAGGSPEQALNQLVGTMVHGLELVRDTRLRPFLDLEGTNDRPKSALFWRSNLAIDAMRADIDGLARFFDGSAMRQLLPDDQASIADSIDFELRQLASLLPPEDRPLDEVLADPAARARLVLLDTVFDSLIDRLEQQYAIATGLSSGFSFSDGD